MGLSAGGPIVGRPPPNNVHIAVDSETQAHASLLTDNSFDPLEIIFKS